MPYEAKAIANYFIDLAKRDGRELTPMKLQKLIYFAHGWSLAIYGKPLIDEQVEAWRFGPVISSIYHEFKRFGSQSITDYAKGIELDKGNILNSRIVVPEVRPDDAETKALLDKIWEIYGGYTAVQLSNATHLPGTPWEKVWGTNGAPRGTDIDQELIKDYFIRLAKQSQATENTSAQKVGG